MVNRTDRVLPAVVQAALAHYQFETLHPFSDGNGRIGRLAIVLQLMQLGILEHPILVVSPWFEARRTEYQDSLLRLSQAGAWDDWVHFLRERGRRSRIDDSRSNPAASRLARRSPTACAGGGRIRCCGAP